MEKINPVALLLVVFCAISLVAIGVIYTCLYKLFDMYFHQKHWQQVSAPIHISIVTIAFPAAFWTGFSIFGWLVLVMSNRSIELLIDSQRSSGKIVLGTILIVALIVAGAYRSAAAKWREVAWLWQHVVVTLANHIDQVGKLDKARRATPS